MNELSTLRLPLSSGQSLGHYTIVKEMDSRNENNPTHLYHTWDTNTNQEVMLKVLTASYPDAGDLQIPLTRFVQEAHIMRHLSHPNILPVLDIGYNRNYYWYVTPYCSKGSLGQYLQLRNYTPLPVQEACEYAIQMCRALEAAHSQVPPIIHRDIKPQNMFFTDNYTLVLADFGIARVMYERHLTQRGVMIGTPEYMAPEQWLVRSKENEEIIDPRLDIYALGCVLYTMLSGRPPFIGTPLAIGLAHREYQAQPLNTLNHHVTLGLTLIVHQAIKKDPDERYLSTAAFAKALAPFVEE